MIFVPGAKSVAPAKLLIAVGLVDHIAGHEVMETTGPPDGVPGALLFWRKPGEGGLVTGYKPESQTWKPAVAESETIPAGRYFVGIDNERPPTEFDLRRPVQFRGHRITLNDQAQWLIPVPRELPGDVYLSDDGRWETEPKRQFIAFVNEAFEWLDFMATIPPDSEVDIEFEKAVRFVVSALRLNYRLTPELVSMIKLFSSEMIQPAIYAACGLLTMAGTKLEG